MASTQELVYEAIMDMKNLYLDKSDKRPWAVAWSGGKDSTTVAAMVVRMLENLPKELRWREVYFVMSDTMMENPNLEAYMRNERKLLSEYAKKNNLPVVVKKVVRPLKDSYFYLIMGKGYPLPMKNGKGRWCTDKLKVKPQTKYLKEIDPCYILTGSRSAESRQRAKSIEKFRIEDKIANYAGSLKCKLFMPIVYFTVEDVWNYLTIEGVPWGSSLPVRTLYKEATGECGFRNPEGVEKKSVEVCGARFGCWTCPVILNDKSTEKMSEIHTWMEPLTEWRQIQLKVYGDYKPPSLGRGVRGEARKQQIARNKAWRERNVRIKLITKSGHRRNGQEMKPGQGVLTVEARELLFEYFMETEKMVNRLRSMQGLSAIKLISEEEIAMIKAQWEDDRKNAPWLVSNPLGLSIDEVREIIEMDDN